MYQLSSLSLLVSKKGWGFLFFSFFKVNIYTECFLFLRVREGRKLLSAHLFFPVGNQIVYSSIFRMVTLLRPPCHSPSQTWWKMTPNVITWAPEMSVYLFQIFQLMRKQILTPYPQGLCSQALWQCSWNGHPLICSFCLQGSMGPTLSLSRFLVSGNPITHLDAEASLLLTPLLCSPSHSLQPALPLCRTPSCSVILLCGSWQEASFDGFHSPLTSLWSLHSLIKHAHLQIQQCPFNWLTKLISHCRGPSLPPVWQNNK